MMKLVKKFLTKWLVDYKGKVAKQRFFEDLHSLALKGMNFGSGDIFEYSGELYVVKYIKSKYPKTSDLIIFDVGGNIGNYAKKLSEVFQSPCVIHAFEPSKKTFEVFIKNTKGIDNIIPNNSGLSDTESTATLFSNEEGSELASVYQRDLRFVGLEMKNKEVINLVTIDNYCLQNNIQRIHFLKLDIEGNELNALNGGKSLLERNAIDFIQFEFGGCNIDSRTFFKDFYFMLTDKYKLYRIVKDGLYEIEQYKETYEIFTTINFLAERRDIISTNQ